MPVVGVDAHKKTHTLEGCRHLTRRLEVDLVCAGHSVVRVPTRLMAAARRTSTASPSGPSPARPAGVVRRRTEITKPQ